MKFFGLAGVVLCFVGCSADRLAISIPVESSHHAILLAIAGGANIQLFAMDERAEPRAMIQLDEHAERELTAFLYDRPLSELALEPGPITVPASDAPSRDVPEPDALFTATLTAGTVDWKPADVWSTAIRLPPTSERACIAAGGCFGVAFAPGECTTPCPEPRPVIPPNPPRPRNERQPPVFTPCPRGWTATEIVSGEDRTEICEPIAVTISPCTGRNCIDLGEPCGADDWAPSIPANAIFVKPGAPAGGTGSRAAPFASIDDAITAAVGPTTIALAKGSYASAVALRDGVTLHGACADETHLDAGVTAALAPGERAGLTALHVAGIISSGGELGLSDVHASGTAAMIDPRAIAASAGASLSGTRLFVDGGGIRIESGATMRVIQVWIEEVTTSGISVVDPGSFAQILGLAVRGVPETSPAIRIALGGAASLEDVFVDRFAGDGIAVGPGTSSATIAGAFVGTRGAAGAGAGVVVRPEASLVLDRATITGAGKGVAVRGKLDLQHAIIRESAGEALDVYEGGRATVSHAIFDAPVLIGRDDDTGTAILADVGLFSIDLAGGALDVQRATIAGSELGVRVRNGDAQLSDVHLTGVNIGGAEASLLYAIRGTIRLERALLETNIRSFVTLTRGTGTATISDVVLRGVPVGQDGFAIDSGSAVFMSRIALESSAGRAIFAGNATSLLIEDLSAANVAAEAIKVIGVPEVHLARIELSSCTGNAIRIEGGAAGLEEINVRDTSGGSGISALHASIDMSHFLLDGNERCGLELAAAGSAELHDGVISGNTTGVCLEGADVSGLLDRVVYRDNEQALSNP